MRLSRVEDLTGYRQRKCGESSMGHLWVFESATQMKQCTECDLTLAWLPGDTEQSTTENL